MLVLALLAGCAGQYFRDAAVAPAPTPASLADWPYQEYWTGIVFNGAKIGFTRLAISALPEGQFRIDSEAALRLRFLGVDKRVQLRASDWVGPDLTLARFEYDYLLDASRLELQGQVQGESLRVTVSTAGEVHEDVYPLDGPLYPTAAIAMYPYRAGLAVGREYAYTVYDGETRSLARVEQNVLGYQTSELFAGEAFKVQTRLHGKSVETWLDARGLPVLEMSLNGVLIAELEPEHRAREYLARAAFNKRDLLLEFSRVDAGRTIEAPRNAEFMRVRLHGIPADFPLPGDTRYQRCRRVGEALECTVRRRLHAPAPPASSAPGDLQPSLAAPSINPRIVALAHEITAGRTGAGERAASLVSWLDANVRKVAVDSFSALDVLDTREAECQGHSYLYTALARAQAIPTRVVNGLVYSQAVHGFAYHTWVESLLDGDWVPLDPTFGQLYADATHVRLLEGEAAADLAPLTQLLGVLRAQVLELR